MQVLSTKNSPQTLAGRILARLAIVIDRSRHTPCAVIGDFTLLGERRHTECAYYIHGRSKSITSAFSVARRFIFDSLLKAAASLAPSDVPFSVSAPRRTCNQA